MKLQDSQDKLKVYEQRSAEQTRMIADLTNKVTELDNLLVDVKLCFTLKFVIWVVLKLRRFYG